MSKLISDNDYGINEFQDIATKTAIYPNKKSTEGLVYCTLGLVGEAGEVAEKIKKVLRDDKGFINPEVKISIIFELGDVLWYIVNICEELNIEPSDLINKNIEKLQQRKKNNTLHGSGDNR